MSPSAVSDLFFVLIYVEKHFPEQFVAVMVMLMMI